VAADINIDWRSVCPISSALDVIGDKWSLLIIRDLIIHGPRTYSELLKSPEHIATNILAARLDLLVGLKLIQRVKPQASQRNNAFQLTESGAELRPILMALGIWAQVHLKNFHTEILEINASNQLEKPTR
jgi:DNA-binding HxlR family transcriptional regulator